jgi:hypothetical protein
MRTRGYYGSGVVGEFYEKVQAFRACTAGKNHISESSENTISSI